MTANRTGQEPDFQTFDFVSRRNATHFDHHCVDILTVDARTEADAHRLGHEMRVRLGLPPGAAKTFRTEVDQMYDQTLGEIALSHDSLQAAAEIEDDAAQEVVGLVEWIREAMRHGRRRDRLAQIELQSLRDQIRQASYRLEDLAEDFAGDLCSPDIGVRSAAEDAMLSTIRSMSDRLGVMSLPPHPASGFMPKVAGSANGSEGVA